MKPLAKKQLTEQEALFRLTALCAQSEQCEFNLREKLRKWGFDMDVQDRVIDYLYDEKYLDESRFAHAYARDKMRYNQWGRQKIEQGMRLLQISQPVRREALLELPEQEYLEILQHILTTKARSVKADNNFERNGKLIRFAVGRGFEMKLILQFLPDADEEDMYYDGSDGSEDAVE